MERTHIGKCIRFLRKRSVIPVTSAGDLHYKVWHGICSCALWDNWLTDCRGIRPVTENGMGFLSHRLFICLLAIAAFATPAFADGAHDRTQFGHDIVVGPDEQVNEVTCFGCSVRIRGHVDADVTTFGGSISVEESGEIGADTTSFGGDVRLDKGSTVHDITVFGGHIRRDSQASVEGDVTTFSGSVWMFLIFGLPFVVLGAFIALIIWIVRRLTRPQVPVAA